MVRAPINLTLPWHSSSVEIADRNFNIVTGKSMKKLNPAKLKIFSRAQVLHSLESYVPKPESEIIPSRPPPAERPAEDQQFYTTPRNPEDSRMRVIITTGSFSLTASQIQEHMALNQENAASISTQFY